LKPQSLEITLTPVDNTRLAALCGPVESHLRQIETALDVEIARRGERFVVSGTPTQSARAITLLEQLYRKTDSPISIDDVQLGIAETLSSRQSANHTATEQFDNPVLITRRADLAGRTPRQREYLRNIANHDITFGIGPAGTGKTYLAVACAVDAYERDTVKRIVLVRPAVEAGERLGFLPGDLTQKVDPYLRPLYDALYDLMGFDKVTRLFEKQAIEIAPLAYMRGRTLNHSFIILDEAQNTTPEQMKMFLTRIGFGTKAVVTGDPTQVDLARHQKSGLADARAVLQGVKGIAMTEFLSADVVRHPLVARIVSAYEARDHALHAKPNVTPAATHG
jgi:phosphate starvation-inducible protein PhoH and related proteins